MNEFDVELIKGIQSYGEDSGGGYSELKIPGFALQSDGESVSVFEAFDSYRELLYRTNEVDNFDESYKQDIVLGVKEVVNKAIANSEFDEKMHNAISTHGELIASGSNMKALELNNGFVAASDQTELQIMRWGLDGDIKYVSGRGNNIDNLDGGAKEGFDWTLRAYEEGRGKGSTLDMLEADLKTVLEDYGQATETPGINTIQLSKYTVTGGEDSIRVQHGTKDLYENSPQHPYHDGTTVQIRQDLVKLAHHHSKNIELFEEKVIQGIQQHGQGPDTDGDDFLDIGDYRMYSHGPKNLLIFDVEGGEGEFMTVYQSGKFSESPNLQIDRLDGAQKTNIIYSINGIAQDNRQVGFDLVFSDQDRDNVLNSINWAADVARQASKGELAPNVDRDELIGHAQNLETLAYQLSVGAKFTTAKDEVGNKGVQDIAFQGAQKAANEIAKFHGQIKENLGDEKILRPPNVQATIVDTENEQGLPGKNLKVTIHGVDAYLSIGHQQSNGVWSWKYGADESVIENMVATTEFKELAAFKAGKLTNSKQQANEFDAALKGEQAILADEHGITGTNAISFWEDLTSATQVAVNPQYAQEDSQSLGAKHRIHGLPNHPKENHIEVVANTESLTNSDELFYARMKSAARVHGKATESSSTDEKNFIYNANIGDHHVTLIRDKLSIQEDGQPVYINDGTEGGKTLDKLSPTEKRTLSINATNQSFQKSDEAIKRRSASPPIQAIKPAIKTIGEPSTKKGMRR